MSFRNIFGLTITISTFIIRTTALDDYSCYCLDQTKNEKFCVLDRGTVSQMSISHNRYTRADLAMGLVLKNYLKATDMIYILFSTSVTNGFKFYRSQNVVTFKYSEDIEFMTRKLNDLFHILNSKLPKEGIQANSLLLKLILDFEKLFEDSCDPPFASPKTIESLRVTLRSIIELISYLCNELEFAYVLTSKFNRECLEKWDQELAEKAQQYANNCPDKQMTDPELLPNGLYLTQNFAIKEFHVQPDISRRFVRFRKVFSEWKDEPKYGSGDRELDGKSNRTNIIRSSTWKMGCGIGVSVKESEGKYREHYVCYYETGKVDDGKPLYRVGCEICKNCPENTKCDELEGIGLCSSRRVAPKFPSEENQIDDVHSCKEKDIKEETDNKNLLWQCNDWKSQNCIVRGICSYTWIIEKDKGFKMENYPLQNTVTSFLFYKKIYLEKESCYSFKYKQFALSNTYSQLAIMAFPNGDINELLWKLMSHGEGIETSISLYLPWKDTHVQVGASVKSLNVDEYEDFIELEDFKIVAGKCRKPKY